MPSFITNAVQVQRFADALYGVAVGTTTMAQVTADITASGGLDNALNAYFRSSFDGVSTTTIAANMCTNLGIVAGQNGLVAADVTTAQNYIVGTLNAAAANARGTAVKGILNNLSALTNDKVFGTAATKFNSDIDKAAAYTGTSDITAGTAPSPVVNNTFALTTGSNNFTGTGGNDTFDAGLSTSSLQTLNSGDRLDGGDGTDEIIATLNTSVSPTTFNSIENVFVTTTATATLDLTASKGVLNITSQGATAATTIAGISKAVNVTLRDTAQAQTVTRTDVAGSADANTININNLSQATTVATTLAGIETLTLNSTGSASTIGLLTASATKSLVITGDKAVTIVDAIATTTPILTVDASAHTAVDGVGVVFTGGFNGANMTVTGGAGNDSFKFLAAGNVLAVGGAGNDTFTFDGTATLNTSDSVAGGAGTADTISTTTTEAIAFTAIPTTYNISGIERLTLSDALTGGNTISLANIDTNINRITQTLANTNAGTATFNFNSVANAGPATLANTLAALGATTAVAAGLGTTDSLTILNVGGAISALGGLALVTTGFETVTINTSQASGAATTQTASTIDMTATGASAPNLVFTGANAFTLTGAITNTGGSIDASGMTGSAGLTMVTGQNTASSITGSPVNDTLFGAITSSISQTVAGGAGNDAIDTGAGNDSITGGADNDTITPGSGSDYVDGGTGNDTVAMAGNLSTGDTIIGGDGTDTLSFTGTVAHTAAIGARVSGFETLTAGGAIADLDMSVYSNNTEFSRVNVAAGTTSISKAGAAVVNLGANVGTTSITFARATNTSADALNLRLGATAGTAATHTAITASGEETLTLTNAATVTTANAQTITTLSDAALTTLNIAGTGGMIVTNPITGATSLATVIDSHSGGGALTLDLSTATVATTFTGSVNSTGATTLILGTGRNIVNHAGTGNITVTGGSGAESMTGSSGADSFSGGSGNDTIIGGAGSDTLSGGAGDDSLDGGAGDDTFTTDSGADTLIGGDGTDTITLSAAFTNLSLDTLSSIETLNMGGFNATMSLANHTALTTISSVGTITLSDAGTVSGKSTVLAYNLANGTNTFTASTTALQNTIVGGTGADTFNFGLLADSATQSFLTADVVTGGTGTDTLNFTGNIAFLGAGGINSLTNVSGVENVVFANTTTAVSVTTADTNAETTGATSMTFDASSLTTGVFTFVGTAEDDSSYIIIGGGAADVITGSAVADTINGGAGGDSITGGLGIDTIDLGAGDNASDTHNVSAVVAVANRDVVSNFTTTSDKVQLGISNTTAGTLTAAAAVTATSTTAAGAGGAAVALTGASSTTSDLIFLTVAAASTDNGDLSTSTTGTELLKAMTSTAAADTYTGITATTAGDKLYFAAVQGGTTYLYYADAGNGDTTFAAAEILLVATYTGSTLVGGDFVMLT